MCPDGVDSDADADVVDGGGDDDADAVEGSHRQQCHDDVDDDDGPRRGHLYRSDYHERMLSRDCPFLTVQVAAAVADHSAAVTTMMAVYPLHC